MSGSLWRWRTKVQWFGLLSGPVIALLVHGALPTEYSGAESGVIAFSAAGRQTLAASCAFMMPVATPPNAIVFGSGEVSIADRARAGLWLNIIGVLLITALTTLWFPRLFP